MKSFHLKVMTKIIINFNNSLANLNFILINEQHVMVSQDHRK
jgi:hypothetical protein